jgi:hypothetical protein
MDSRRAYLKDLAARSARAWGSTPLPPVFAGETRIETRNTIYQLRDGVCYAVNRNEEAGQGRAHPSAFVGMRIVGWLMREDPRAGISLDWRPGAYAVLWRSRAGSTEHSAVALTSSSSAFRVVARTVPAPLPEPSRQSAPPPATLRVPPPLVARAPAPPSFAPPAPPSTTRMHPSVVPQPPDTPTPLRRTASVPPPLPSSRQAPSRPAPSSRRAAVRPLPLRVPAISS